MEGRSGLHSAIAIAEMHSNGVAIGVRLSTNQDLITGQGRPTGQQQSRPADRDRPTSQQQPRPGDQDRPTSQQPTRPADQDRQTGQQSTRSGDQDRQSGQSGQLFAIVTCVVDGTRVRDVIIDMGNNSVIGIQTAEFRGSQQHGLDYERDYDSSSGAASYARASDLMNATVRNRADKKLGDIDDLAIDPDANRVVYGVLRRGGFMGIGESRYAISSNQLAPLRNGRIMLDMDESRFENVSGFSNSDWPTKAESRLVASGTTQDTDDAPTAKRVVKASNIIGENVQCRDGNTVGKISDLIVEGRNGRVLYAIVNSNRGHMPVPMGALNKTDDKYTLPMSMNQLRSMPTLDTDRDQNWSDASWNRRIHEGYNTKFETASARDDR
ncbi:MAG: PRC-barrel domain containing protein [Phycisphaerales bacterium]|nr:MAG: PRC-barrel domain containing protein [Phycisphaerales bacterium]